MDRKNYFYPDLTKNYQTSQYDLPMCVDGMVNFTYEGKEVSVRINRIHIEEDAGKLVHLEDEPVSLIDYNRAGVPLVEIVTEPDLRSPEEAAEFMRQLKGILEYADISDCRMEQGSIRCDANISLRPYGSEEYGTKVEIKNINSFREVQKALEKEDGYVVDDQLSYKEDEAEGLKYTQCIEKNTNSSYEIYSKAVYYKTRN